MSGEKKVGNSGKRVDVRKCSKAGQFCAKQYGDCHREENGIVWLTWLRRWFSRKEGGNGCSALTVAGSTPVAILGMCEGGGGSFLAEQSRAEPTDGRGNAAGG